MYNGEDDLRSPERRRVRVPAAASEGDVSTVPSPRATEVSR